MADASSEVDRAMAAAAEIQKNLEREIYFYRTGDATAWNYSILALSFLGLFVGLFLLGKNILNNRKRKMDAMYQMNTASIKEEEPKQAVWILEKEKQAREDVQLNKEAQPGAITVQWNDGQITSLYLDAPEEEV